MSDAKAAGEQDIKNLKMAAARRYCQWHLGSPDWADNIIHAYTYPSEAHAKLDQERSRYETTESS